MYTPLQLTELKPMPITQTFVQGHSGKLQIIKAKAQRQDKLRENYSYLSHNKLHYTMIFID